ncbi:dr1-associated corepressor homolog [Diorhabda sublineata]|uniref:dr1-associated corepressor homolog n=1 Tax=Diorhabda sublineata TaxID=1163346 RepID=UPI0024E0B8C7|nr:dr1-associated corepressor homolog [Diorhabda sublineata]XP_056641295.1 dr1-associated corepressor homolog [Diorhabda sublineata]
MPSKKKKYNARFPAGRIKKIMQTDEEVGKVAQAVPVIISRTLELFVESLLTKSMQITQARNAKTLTPSHMKQCILSESRFDFLKDLVKNVPDASVQEDNENNALFEEGSFQKEEAFVDEPSQSLVSTSYKNRTTKGSIQEKNIPCTEVHPSSPSTEDNEQSSSTSRTPVIQYGPKIVNAESTKINFSVNNLLKPDEPKLHITIASEELPTVPQLTTTSRSSSNLSISKVNPNDNVPPLLPITNRVSQNSNDNSLYIDEDYDN